MRLIDNGVLGSHILQVRRDPVPNFIVFGYVIITVSLCIRTHTPKSKCYNRNRTTVGYVHPVVGQYVEKNHSVQIGRQI